MFLHLITTHRQQILTSVLQKVQDASISEPTDGNPEPKPMNALLSDIFGYVSFVCWLCVLVPQLWLNYKRKSSEGLSLGFILMWLAGDFTDWYGAYVGRLLLPAILIALYFVVTDVVLLAQMFIYHKSDDDVFGASQLPEGAERPPLLVRRGRRAVKLSDPGYTQRRLQEYLEAEREALIERGIIPEIHVSGENSRLQQRRVSSYGAVDPIHGQHGSGKQGSTGGFKSAVLRLCDYVSRRLTSLREMGSGKTGRAIAIATLVLVVLIAIGVGSRVFLSYYPQHITDVVSQVFGYISAAMFFIAYIPQIAWNFTAQSTEGLSASMFVFTVLGNVTYCLSILAMSTEKDYLIAYAPWLAGALGTLGFEMLVLWQCYFYSRPQSTDSQSGSTSGNNTEVAESEDRDGGSTSENENDVGSLLSRRAHRRSRRRRYSGVTGKSLSRSRTRYSPGSSQHHLALSSSIEEEEASLG